MKLFHGSYETTAPEIKIGEFAMTSDNIFDGIFASANFDVADSHAHGGKVFSYEVSEDKIALSSDLDNEFETVCSFLRDTLGTDNVEEIADRIMWDNDEDIEEFAEILSTRTLDKDSGSLSWELQRLRGRVAAHLGFDAVEMGDEHGTSYLIVNPKIKGKAHVA